MFIQKNEHCCSELLTADVASPVPNCHIDRNAKWPAIIVSSALALQYRSILAILVVSTSQAIDFPPYALLLVVHPVLQFHIFRLPRS